MGAGPSDASSPKLKRIQYLKQAIDSCLLGEVTMS
jgi:hypothetical protein